MCALLIIFILHCTASLEIQGNGSIFIDSYMLGIWKNIIYLISLWPSQMDIINPIVRDEEGGSERKSDTSIVSELRSCRTRT